MPGHRQGLLWLFKGDVNQAVQGDIDIDVEGRCTYKEVFWLLLKRCFKVSSGTLQWYRCSYGTDSDKSEIVSPSEP